MPPSVSLTTRLTAFTLGALALVLAGFSATLFLMTQSGLSRQADDRLDAALSTLQAAVEFHDDGFEWEPNERLVALGQEPGADEVRWAVHEGHGALVERSVNLGSPRLLAQLPPPGPDGPRSFQRVRLDGRPWRVVQRRLGPADPGPPVKVRPYRHYPRLTLTAALCLEPADATLRQLGRLLAGLSAGVWLLAAALGRGFCRRALRPLSRMAEAARGAGAAEFDLRLPDPGTGDELGDLADAFNGLLDRLHEAFARQARFTGDASHQLRTPLAAMLGQIDVALRRDRPADDYRRTLGLVRQQVAHLSGIVETLLFLARADAEADLPDRQVIDLTSWSRDHLASWSAHPRAPDISLEVVGEPDRPIPVRVHPPLLGQLLDNLLDNACKYSDPGSPVLVRLAVSPPAGALLTVADRGSGIDPSDRPHVFDPFFRSPRARRQGRPGVGLGLTIALRIASSFGGRLEALDRPGGGSEFALTLPLAQDEPIEELLGVTQGT
jgi:signal transduction histidine kinase